MRKTQEFCRIGRESAVEALRLKPGVEVVKWKICHPVNENAAGGRVRTRGDELAIEPDAKAVHQSRSGNHRTVALVARLSNRGEKKLIVRAYPSEAEPERVAAWVRNNAKRLEENHGVLLPKGVKAEGKVLFYPAVAGRRVDEDELLSVWQALHNGGLFEHPFVKGGHWRANEHGIYLIPD